MATLHGSTDEYIAARDADQSAHDATHTFMIEASFERDGQLCDSTDWETLGDDYGHVYATRDEAEQVAERLQEDLSETDLDPSTRYSVVASDRPFATGARVCGGEPGTEDYDTGTLLRYETDDTVTVQWDSEQTTRCPVSVLRVL